MPPSTPWYVRAPGARDELHTRLRELGFAVEEHDADTLVIHAAPARSLEELREEFKAMDELVAEITGPNPDDGLTITLHGNAAPLRHLEDIFRGA